MQIDDGFKFLIKIRTKWTIHLLYLVRNWKILKIGFEGLNLHLQSSIYRISFLWRCFFALKVAQIPYNILSKMDTNFILFGWAKLTQNGHQFHLSILNFLHFQKFFIQNCLLKTSNLVSRFVIAHFFSVSKVRLLVSKYSFFRHSKNIQNKIFEKQKK